MNRHKIESHLCRKGRGAFVCSLPRGAKVLDVGCGNRSPEIVKSLRPDLYYVGVDVCDYRQTSKSRGSADEYILCPPENFAKTLHQFAARFDAVVSKHNIEHCYEADGVLRAMCAAVRTDGRLYVSTPCAESVGFPSRQGTLNFYDDPTHNAPVDIGSIEAVVKASGLSVTFCARRYRPPILALAGWMLEPLSGRRQRVAPAGMTWACYGFESILWAQRHSVSPPMTNRVADQD